MTYISAFYCEEGIVMCADTQETLDDQKRDVEKLYVSSTYPLAVGGAGMGEAIDAFAQELIGRVEQDRPPTVPELKTIIEASLKENHEKDAASSNWPAEYRKAQYLIAARPNHDSFVLYRVKGKRLYVVKKRVIIGLATAANEALFKRMYRPNLPMQQAVMLAVYLVSQSKAIDAYVSGETRVAVVNSDIAWLDYPEYLDAAEKRVAQFLKLIDDLFLFSVDVSIPPSRFQDVLEAFSGSVNTLRQAYLHESTAISLARAQNDPDYRGEPYNKIFLGAIVGIDGSGVKVREETKEEVEQRRQMMREAAQAINKDEAAQVFQTLVRTHGTPEYIGEEIITVQGSGGPET
jgi:20S proteasome alpha/beta subunit